MVDLARLAHEWFGPEGCFVAGFDCAILAGKPLKEVGERSPPQHVHAMMHLPTGKDLLVTSLRLIPPEGRLDFWNLAAWRSTTANRQLRRTQLKEALEREPAYENVPEVLGGDFNAPANDLVFKLLTQFADAYREAGCGWGNTGLNNLPNRAP